MANRKPTIAHQATAMLLNYERHLVEKGTGRQRATTPYTFLRRLDLYVALGKENKTLGRVFAAMNKMYELYQLKRKLRGKYPDLFTTLAT